MTAARIAERRSFESSSLSRHLVLGVVGFGSLAGSFALVPLIGLFGLLLAPLGMVALRGCPVCWTVGLMQTLSRGRLERSCADGSCRLVRPAAETARAQSVPAETVRVGGPTRDR